MEDSLKKLITMITSSGCANQTSDRLVQLLTSFHYNHEAFLYLYCAIPDEHKPDFKTSHSYFKETFIKAICVDEKTFNKHFFKGVHEAIDIAELRNIYRHFPNNKKLATFYKQQDNPQNLDEIIDSLTYLWKNNLSNYDEMYNKHLVSLYGIHKASNKSTDTAKKFSSWSFDIIEREGLDAYFKFCKNIKLEPFNFCKKSDRKVCDDLERMTVENLQYLITYAENNLPTLNFKYQVIETMCYSAKLMDVLNDLAIKGGDKNIEKFAFIWNNSKEYLKCQLIAYATNTKEKNALEVLEETIKNLFPTPELTYDKISKFAKATLENIYTLGSYVELNNAVIIQKSAINKKIKI